MATRPATATAPGESTFTTSAAAQASLVSPVASLLSRLKHSCTKTHAAEEWLTRRHINSPTPGFVDDASHAQLASSDAIDLDNEAEDSNPYNSNTLPPFPDLLAAEAADNNNGVGRTNVVFDTGATFNGDNASAYSQASHLAPAHTLLLDTPDEEAEQTQRPMEETIADHVQQSEHHQFVMVNYVFVMFLMTFHGLSNTIATLYLSFALHVLSCFCAFVDQPPPSSSLDAD